MDTNTFRKRIHDPNGYLDEQLQEAYAASEPGDYQLPNLMRSQPDDLAPLVPAPQIDVGMGAPSPAPFQREAIPFPTEQAVAQKDLMQQQDNPFSDERRNQMVDEANSGRVLSGIGQALSGFLAPVTGRSQDSVTNQFEGFRKQRAANTVGQFDAKKALYQSMQAKLAETTEETRRYESERAFDRQKLDVEMRFKAGQLGLDEAKQKLAEIESARKADLEVNQLALEKEKFGETVKHNRNQESIGWKNANRPESGGTMVADPLTGQLVPIAVAQYNLALKNKEDLRTEKTSQRAEAELDKYQKDTEGVDVRLGPMRKFAQYAGGSDIPGVGGLNAAPFVPDGLKEWFRSTAGKDARSARQVLVDQDIKDMSGSGVPVVEMNRRLATSGLDPNASDDQAREGFRRDLERQYESLLQKEKALTPEARELIEKRGMLKSKQVGEILMQLNANKPSPSGIKTTTNPQPNRQLSPAAQAALKKAGVL